LGREEITCGSIRFKSKTLNAFGLGSCRWRLRSRKIKNPAPNASANANNPSKRYPAVRNSCRTVGLSKERKNNPPTSAIIEFDKIGRGIQGLPE